MHSSRAARKFLARPVDRAQRCAVVNPRNARRGEKEDLELHCPKLALEWKPDGLCVREAFCVKGNVLGLVAENEIARFLDDRIFCPSPKQMVIGGANQLCDDKHFDFKLNSQCSTQGPEQCVRPMLPDEPTAQTFDQAREQPCVFLFLADEKCERFAVLEIVSINAARLSKQASALAALTKLEM
jgi:hypothetical protein